MKRQFTLLLAATAVCFNVMAQNPASSDSGEVEKRLENLEKQVAGLKKLKVSGYIQTQAQWGQEDASLKVGSGNENSEKSFNRIGIRRGRLKFTYTEGIATGVFQLDITEKKVGFKDAYLNIQDPWIHSMALRAGIFDRPFGFEIGYSSSRRESPERSTIFQTLFPDERDLGAMFILQAPKSSPWNVLKLEAGLFAGNGINKDTDNKKDFIGHLSAAKKWNTTTLGGGFSYYNGRVYQGSENVYTMQGNEFKVDDNPNNSGGFAKREYYGFDLQFTLKSGAGLTQLRGEYLWGQQPGTIKSSNSPKDSELPKGDTYIRDFKGGYVMLVQGIGQSPVSLVCKYDWYDPNTDVSKDDIGLRGTGAADLYKSTVGIGAIWDIMPSLKLQTYLDINKNEKTKNVDGFAKNRKDNVFTLRLQYKF